MVQPVTIAKDVLRKIMSSNNDLRVAIIWGCYLATIIASQSVGVVVVGFTSKARILSFGPWKRTITSLSGFFPSTKTWTWTEIPTLSLRLLRLMRPDEKHAFYPTIPGEALDAVEFGLKRLRQSEGHIFRPEEKNGHNRSPFWFSSPKSVISPVSLLVVSEV